MRRTRGYWPGNCSVTPLSGHATLSCMPIDSSSRRPKRTKAPCSLEIAPTAHLKTPSAASVRRNGKPMIAIRYVQWLSWSLLVVACGQSGATRSNTSAGSGGATGGNTNASGGADVAPPTCPVTDEEQHACGSPGDLTGSTLVRETWSNSPSPELVGQPLVDGRYVQTARTLYCAEQYDPPPVLTVAQSVLEVSNCIIRIHRSLNPGDMTNDVLIFSVQTFSYAPDGKLILTKECPGLREASPATAFGFDGSTIRLFNPATAISSTGESYDCQYVDTWQKS
jgi:hypothetical protein